MQILPQASERIIYTFSLITLTLVTLSLQFTACKRLKYFAFALPIFFVNLFFVNYLVK